MPYTPTHINPLRTKNRRNTSLPENIFLCIEIKNYVHTLFFSLPWTLIKESKKRRNLKGQVRIDSLIDVY